MSNAIVQFNFDELSLVAKAMTSSGFFQDIKQESQAIVKILAGQEMGLPAFASMTGIHIIQGRPTLGANLIASLIKNDPRYNYRVVQLEDKVCSIDFYEGGEKVGNSTFTAEDAKKAQTKNMDKYAKNMLFARAISNGAKWFTPGIFGGTTVYTPEELGADVDEEGNILETTFVETEHSAQTEQTEQPKVTAPPATNGKNGNGKTFTGNVVEMWVLEGYFDDKAAAASVFNRSPFVKGQHTLEAVNAWGRAYRAWRDSGVEAEAAIEKATAGEVPA